MSVFRPVRARVLLWAALGATMFPALAAAQQPAPTAVPSGPLTLGQVLEIAAARSESIGVAEAGIRRAQGERTRARSGLFPQLSVSAGYDRALASEFSGIFNNVGNPGAGNDSGTGDNGDTDFSRLPFGRANTWRLSLAFSQNLYSGGRNGLQQTLAELGGETAGQGLSTARAELLYQATQAYYDAALADRLVAIADATVQQASATLQQVQAGFDAGTQPEFEVLRARVNRDNQQPVLIRQRMTRDIAILRLKQLLDLPADADLRLADALSDETLAPPPVFASRVTAIEDSLVDAGRATLSSLKAGIAPPDRTVIAQAETVVRQGETSLKLAEAARKPTVSLNSTYSRVAYPADDAFPTFDRTNWTVGFSVQVPILTGGRQRGDEAVARADLDSARLRLQQTKELSAVDTQSAWAELLAARAAWEASAGTVQQATRAYDIADVRYRNGVSTQLELTDARLLLQQAEANRAIAARDLQVARARVALLPDLPLGATTGAAPATPQPPATAQPAAPQPPSQQQPSTPGQFTTASATRTQGQTGTR
jgi:outer membrane protein TolC